jgi:PAS domain S-box-containing protein
MSALRPGRQIVWLVRVLSGTAVLAVVATVTLVGWTLASSRHQREEANAAQTTLNRASDELRQHVVASRAEIRGILDETVPDTHHQSTVQNLVQFVALQLSSSPDPAVKKPLIQLRGLTTRLVDLAHRAQDWRDAYSIVWADIQQEHTIGQVRDLLTQLRSGVDTLEGSHRMKDAMKYNRWQHATGDDAARQAAAILQEQAKRESLDSADFNSQLSELARLVELLGGEEQFDGLADIKDNQLKPALDRLSDSIASLAQDPDISANLTPQAVENLRVAIFGKGYKNDDAHQDIEPGVGGLYVLRRDALQLRRQRDALKIELTTLAQDMEAANATFAQFAEARTDALNRETEDSLKTVWSRMVIIGAVCLVVFLWLAFIISRGIRGHVRALDEARAEAEAGRQTTQKLMLQQQAANQQLALAHNNLRASEQRFRTLSTSAPLGICETDAVGKLLYANAQWEKIAGISVADATGEGWARALHPDDAQVLSDWKNAAESGQDFIREFRFRTEGQEARWVSVRTTPIRSEGGQVLGHVATVEDITGRKKAEEQLEVANKKLLDTSRQAGMAEVATGVLHNVGNVLNSVNISSSLVAEKVQKSKIAHFTKAVGLMRDHQADLGSFVTADPQGKHLLDFFSQLSEHLSGEQAAMLKELAHLQKNVEHIKEIVSTQQAYASSSGFNEMVDLRELLEDALRIHRAAIMRHDINIIQEFAQAPQVLADKHKVLQILVNLLSNAKHAMKQSSAKTLTLKIETTAETVRVSVTDSGMGIPPENMTRIFAHGFTTKKDGHGFGLHSGALAAKQMGGELRAASEGSGKGATFTLELPLQAKVPATAA